MVGCYIVVDKKNLHSGWRCRVGPGVTSPSVWYSRSKSEFIEPAYPQEFASINDNLPSNNHEVSNNIHLAEVNSNDGTRPDTSSTTR